MYLLHMDERIPLSKFEGDINKGLITELRRLANKHLGSPWTCEINLSDDGSVSIEIFRTFGYGDDPVIYSDREIKDTLGVSDERLQRMHWREALYWRWSDEYMQYYVIYRMGSNDDWEIYEKESRIEDMSKWDGIIDEMDERESIIETSTGDVRDGFSKKRKTPLQRLKSTETKEGLPTDAVAKDFQKAFELWITELRYYFEDMEQIGSHAYDFRNYGEKAFVEDSITKFDLILDELNHLHQTGATAAKNHQYKYRKLHAEFRVIEKEIRPVGKEFAELWRMFCNYMVSMFERIEEVGQFKL